MHVSSQLKAAVRRCSGACYPYVLSFLFFLVLFFFLFIFLLFFFFFFWTNAFVLHVQIFIYF